jgi:outer membrane protein OmpA-like peptidoglycan-associated protein
MTHARPLYLKMLFVAAGVLASNAASAQKTTSSKTPPKTTTTAPAPAPAPVVDTAAADSAKSDSVAPKKKSRFAGLKDKAKSVASNKRVQDAAKGAACTVVPGAAISAATGQGPCANAGLVGSMMSGGKAAAAASAAGMASGAAANLANKGGLVGAAAGAGLGALNGVTGLSPAVAQANAMKIMMGAKANGMSTAAAQAAAMQMMTSNGMSTAMSTAAINKMVKEGNKATTPADAAAAMQMIQAMGLAASAGATSIPTNTRLTASPASPMYTALSSKSGRTVTQGIAFESGSDRLLFESMSTLKSIAGMLTDNPNLRIRIESYTDQAGAKDSNRFLSEKRAEAIKISLVRDFQIDASRLDSKGFGDTKPVNGNNNRVELVKM